MQPVRFVRLAAAASASALLVAALGGAPRARAAAKPTLAVRSVNVAGLAAVHLNQVVEVKFSAPVDPATVNPATFRIRAQNATGTGFTRQVPGEFQTEGSVVRFFPRLPTHLRNPADPNGGFHPVGSPLDAAANNAGFSAGTKYELEIVGHPAISAVRSTRNRVLRSTQKARFSTSSSARAEDLYSPLFYSAGGSPEVAFTNPPDRPASPDVQYVVSGGAREVPTTAAPSIFFTQVPLAPVLVRRDGGLTVTQIGRNGDASARRTVAFDAFLEQSFDTTRIAVQPRFRLSERSVFALRISKDVRDLSERTEVRSVASRERLRALYDFLSSARAAAPTLPWDQLPDPPASLIPDWPAATSPTSRGVLKRNLLLLGDAHPEEIDPRVALIFTTRDEPVARNTVRVEFAKTEPLFDAPPSTAEWDAGVPGAASAVPTVAGGTGVDGDFKPVKDTTLSTDSFTGGEMNFRDVVIPAGVKVTIVGSRPAVMKSFTFTLDGTIDVSGSAGATGVPSIFAKPEDVPRARGGAGGPGGGAGGDAGDIYKQLAGQPVPTGFPGMRGRDSTGTSPVSTGGSGGSPGAMAPGLTSSFSYGAGGGGGGGRLPGFAGQNGASTNPSWNGLGGAGGAASPKSPFDPIVGGAGGGAGGNGATADPGKPTSNKGGSAGGGGGGALVVQVAKTLTLGTTARILARGGAGGALVLGNPGSGGPGGGGAGGSVLLRSGKGLSIANPAGAIDVSGGPGGTGPAGAGNYSGGAGGAGATQIEDPVGGITVPGGSGGTFDPVGGGVPSVVYTKWIDLGPSPARVLPFTTASAATTTQNDAIVVEVQMTRESPVAEARPDTTAIDTAQNSTNRAVSSDWLPAKVHDRSGSTAPGGLLGVPGYDATLHGEQRAFAVDPLNGKGYRFVRFRVRFQLDPAHRRADPVPYVDFVEAAYETN